MPVEIRELIIRARVESSGNTQLSEDSYEHYRSSEGVSANNLNTMISDLIKRQKER